MWYANYLQLALAKTNKPEKQAASTITAGYDEEILRIDAENSVRRRLHYQGEYNPQPEMVEDYVDTIMASIKKKYTTYNNVRWESPNGKLNFAVDGLLDEVLPLRTGEDDN